jgi:hypothetical protein
MVKFLFFDFRHCETVRGFVRQLDPPRKHKDSPFLVSDHPAEGNYMSLYGSVIRRPDDGLWQTWYTVQPPGIGLCLAYAESQDGVHWERPKLGNVPFQNEPSHLVFDAAPHGATVIYDKREERPNWKYKMLCGAKPSGRICAFHSPDGIRWTSVPLNPVTGSHPDCPMSLHRANDGHYVAYHRPFHGDRRVGRSESWDFIHWSEAKLVMEPDAGDPTQIQFYGLGAIPYGDFEIGTLWIYHTVEDDMDFYKMRGHQQPELVYCRSGYAWHRAAQETPWIRRGKAGSWDWGLIQCASSPVFLEDEIRFYYAGFRVSHAWTRTGEKDVGTRCGIGMASMKPDRFVGLTSGPQPGQILTRPFWTETPEFYVNAVTRNGGYLKAEITELDGKPVPGFGLQESEPFAGDALGHRLSWRGRPNPEALAHRQIRLRVRGRQATVYSLFSGAEHELKTYWKFRIPFFLDMDKEKALR